MDAIEPDATSRETASAQGAHEQRMNISELFIQRPVMTVLVMLGVVVFGIVAYQRLPVSDLPTVDFPDDQRQREPAGRESGDDGLGRRDAAREAVLDDRRHRQHDVDRARSARRQITLQFALDRDIDAAAQDVQAAIAQTLRSLPPGIIPPSYQKVNPADAADPATSR